MRLSRLVSALLLVAACASPRPKAAVPGAPATDRSLPTWANGAVFYEVFVRSFQDSDGDGKGDLRGLISRLDYLNDGDAKTDRDLGIDALWLMPVFASPSYHGYDTADYETINPDYGSNADFAQLIAEAHRRGMHVVVDLVLNHTSAKHPWFVESASSPASPRRDWYVWSPTDLHWPQPWNDKADTWHEKNGAFYYGLFWAGMPDLNFRNPAVRAEARRIAALWLSRGVDGFRLDAARHLIETGPGEHGQNDTEETHQFWKEFAAYVRSVAPEAALIGENWTETPIIATYYGSTGAVPGGDELPLNFDFPLASKIVEGVKLGETKSIAAKLEEIRALYPPGATDVPFLANHDQRRIASVLGDDPLLLRSAAAILLTLPGTPFLYYGEEIGLDNGPGQEDEEKRTPMPWDASTGGGFSTGKPWHAFAPGKANVQAQSGDPSSLLSHYRKLIHARHASPALGHGALKLLLGDGPLLAYLREGGGERVLVAHNLGDAPRTANLDLRASAAEPIFQSQGASVVAADGGVSLTLPPHASGVFRLR